MVMNLTRTGLVNVKETRGKIEVVKQKKLATNFK